MISRLDVLSVPLLLLHVLLLAVANPEAIEFLLMVVLRSNVEVSVVYRAIKSADDTEEFE